MSELKIEYKISKNGNLSLKIESDGDTFANVLAVLDGSKDAIVEAGATMFQQTSVMDLLEIFQRTEFKKLETE